MNGPPATAPRGLYLITPDESDTDRLLSRVNAVLGQATWLQYRNKAAAAALRREQAAALKAICAAAGVPLIINDDPELAREIDADGVHLGEDDGGPAAAREALGTDAIVGVSCYDDLGMARRAAAAGASYLAFGAFHPTRNKATVRRAAPQVLRDAARWGLPRVAIGGITPDNAAPLVAAGADLLAVIGAVFESQDPPAAARALRHCFERPAPA